jgi:phage terminase Nu1 subunit (DNA packaging protein)
MRTIEMDSPCTQEVFGALVGVTQQAVSELTARGVLNPGDSVGQWLYAYCRNLREVAAGRASMAPGGLDLVQERAALARSQRERVDLQNAAARGEQAPIELLGEALAGIIQIMVSELDRVDGLISQTAPDCPESTRYAVLNCIGTARNKAAARIAGLDVGAEPDTP